MQICLFSAYQLQQAMYQWTDNPACSSTHNKNHAAAGVIACQGAQRVSTSRQHLRRPQLVSARDVLQQMRGCAHLMRPPVHLLRLDAAHINLPTAELQQYSMPHQCKAAATMCSDNFIHIPDPDASPSFADKCIFGSWSLDSYHYKKAAASSTVFLPL